MTLGTAKLIHIIESSNLQALFCNGNMKGEIDSNVRCSLLVVCYSERICNIVNRGGGGGGGGAPWPSG